MADFLKVHKAVVTVNSVATTYYVLQRDLYAAIKNTVGVQVGTDAEQDKPTIRVGELLKAGILIRVAITYTEDGVSKAAKILCLRDQLNTALADLPGKAWSGGTIARARVPRRRTLI